MENLLPSATVIVLKQGTVEQDNFEVLLVQRNAKLKTHGGAWVFPGGKVDQNDIEGAADFYQLDAPQKLRAAQRAAARELKEEAGIDLSTDDMRLFSTWVTPPSLPKRFDTWFFLSESNHVDVQIDDGEIHDFMWVSPVDALAKQNERKIFLPPPTYISLLYLSHYKVAKTAKTAKTAITELAEQPQHFKPILLEITNGFCSLYEEDEGYAASDVDKKGKQHRLYMDQDGYRYVSDY